jgi:hypothetical protein
MKKNNLLIELNRVNELMGTKQLISEQAWVDDMVLKLVNISTRSGSKIPDLITALRNSQTIDEKSNNLLRLINQSRKEQNKEILNVIKSALKETSELVYKQMIRNINNPKLSNVITKLKSEGKTEDEIVDILMGRLQLVSTNDSLADDLLADEYAKRMRKKVKEVYQGPKPNPINGLSVNFTKFLDDKVGKMIDAAKLVNEAANKLSKGGLSGNEIKDWENTIKKNMQTIFYEDQSIIEFMEKEIAQGVKNRQPGFREIESLMSKLKKDTTISDMPWKSGPIAEKLTNKWSVFLNETLKSSFADWIWVYKSLGKLLNTSKRWLKIKETINNITSIDAGGVIQKANSDAKKTISGAVVLPNWKRQLNVTLLGSPRGIPIKGSKADAYAEIIKVFKKKPLMAARASLIIEKIIKIIKLTITLEVIQTLVNYTRFFSTNKKVQTKYGNCINELTNAFRVEGQDAKNMFVESQTSDGVTYSANTWVPKCFTKLLYDKNVSDDDIRDIVTRSHYFSQDKGVIDRTLESMNIFESTWKFIASSRIRISAEIYNIWKDIEQGQITGQDSVIDELVSDINTLSNEIKPLNVSTSNSSSTNSTQTNSQNQNQTGTTTVNKPKEPPLDPGFIDPFK